EDETPRDIMLGLSLDDLPQGLRFLSLAHIEVEMADLHAVARLPHLETLLLTDLAFQLMHWFNLPYPSLRILGVKSSRAYFSAGFLPLLAGSVKHLALVGLPVATIDDYRASYASLPSRLESFLVHLAPVYAGYGDDPDSPNFIESEVNLKRCGEAANVRVSVKRNATPEEVDAFDLEEWALSVGQLS
ncbi:hypothetical protein JCM10049v2_006231, partial [Rhodotorula toruloides]